MNLFAGGGGLEFPDCIACLYDHQRCEIPYLRGSVVAVAETASEAAPGGRLVIALEDGRRQTVLLGDAAWLRLLPQVGRVLRQASKEGPGGSRLEIAAFHLRRVDEATLATGPGGVVVLEPDWLINVTDLTEMEYCPRVYLVRRFELSEPGLAMLRGNILHQTFEQILRTPDDEGAIVAALRAAFFAGTREMALLDQTKAAMWEQVKEHYARLKAWARTSRRPGTPFSETFLLAPQLGMKGKIDALWFDAGSAPVIVELKTGRSMGEHPKPGHAFQAGAYSLMTAARGWSRPDTQRVMVLYSGNPELMRSINIERQIPQTIESLRTAIAHRNQLVLSDYLSDAPFETRQPNKCIQCSVGLQCAAISDLLGHSDPRPKTATWIYTPDPTLTEPDRAWFRTFARLLFMEFRAVKSDHAALWRQSPQERVELGRTFLAQSSRLTKQEGERFVYLLEGDNQSELREEDFVLVSDAAGPMAGMIAQGTVRRPLENGLEVEFGEALKFEPRIVDSYVSEGLVERQFAGIWAWLHQEKAQRDLVIGRRGPRFSPQPLAPQGPAAVGTRSLNTRQVQAVQAAVNMDEALLVLGPPGSGKTTLIVALVRESLHLKQRILLAAGTNTALDNMLKPLIAAGFGDQVLRLGVESRTDPAVRAFVPEALARSDDLDTQIKQMRALFATRQIVGATATTWLSNSWKVFGRFDVAIVDEAAQITLPAALGALRLARKFILIGDHRQLPPVVISAPRQAEGGEERLTEERLTEERLALSLFERLFLHYEQHCPAAVVRLNEQYRMNSVICALPQQLWYDADLRPATTAIANARLALARPVSGGSELAAGPELITALDPQHPVVFIDVPWAQAGCGPRTNPREAQLVGEILSAYLQAGLNLANVGVIAPFRAQVALIRRTLEARLPEDARAEIRGMVDTVDRFQGQERELVVISLATHGEFIHDLLQDERRLNVALTRAKHKLIILGDRRVLGYHPTYATLLQLCRIISL